jgi:hypothetical protein
MVVNQREEADSTIQQYCDVLRRAAEAGGLLVDAMTGTSDGSKENSSPVPLMVVENGCGSPCIDMMQGSSELAAAAKDADLVKSPHVQVYMLALPRLLFLTFFREKNCSKHKIKDK